MNLSSDVMIGLTSFQFALYLILFALCVWKLALASNFDFGFMKIFFAILLVYIIWELSLQTYQLIEEAVSNNVRILVMVGMNT